MTLSAKKTGKFSLTAAALFAFAAVSLLWLCAPDPARA